MRGRRFENGICRCGHRAYQHGYVGAFHWCSGLHNEHGDVCPCERYVRDRRKAAER